jgi:DeoR family transcriptional regulator of aga operon
VELDVAVLGVDAFDPATGAKATDEEEAAINRLMAEQAKTTVIVAESSKLEARAFARICRVEEVNFLVVDAGASPQALATIRAAGTTVVVV